MSIQATTPALQSASLSAMATVLTAASPLLKRISQVDGEYKYNVSMVYFWAEVVKLAVATCIFCCGSTGDFGSAVRSGSTQMRFSLTAFLFFVQNNMGFIVLLYFSASSFQLLMNLRIVAVALFSMLLLGKSPTELQWCFIILLCTGGTQHFLSIQGDEPLTDSSILGLGAMLLTVATSALANVYNQLALQIDNQQPLMLQNMFLYAYGVIFNALNWMRSVYMEGNQLAGDVTPSVILLILFNAAYGLCISAVLKHLGAMVRSVLGILAIVVTALGEYFFFGTVPGLFTDTTFVVIILSAQAYSQSPSAPPKPAEPSASVTAEQKASLVADPKAAEKSTSAPAGTGLTGSTRQD